jgi:hypothetical protein
MAYRSPVNQENFSKFAQQTQELKVGLVKIMPSFSTKKSWADTERSLQKLFLHFQHVETPYIYQKPMLFRRLALCLNQREEGIHQTVMDIYDRILANLQKNGEFQMNDLFFVTMGIFPYLQTHLYQQNKRVYRLIVTYFLPLREQLGPMVPALLSALLPGLIENNSEAEKTVYDIIYALFAALPKAFVYTSIWLVIFRSPTSRFGALKFLSHHLGQMQKQALDVFGDEFIPENQIVPSEMPQLKQVVSGNFPPVDPIPENPANPGPNPLDHHLEGVEAHSDRSEEPEEGQPPFQPTPLPQIRNDQSQQPPVNQVQTAGVSSDQRVHEVENIGQHPRSVQNYDLQEAHGFDYEDHTGGNQQAWPSDPPNPDTDPFFAGPNPLATVEETMREDRVDSANDAPISSADPELPAQDTLVPLGDFAVVPSEGTPPGATGEVEFAQEFRQVEETDFNEYETFRTYCRDTYQSWSEYITLNCKNEVFSHKSTVIEALVACLGDENGVIVMKALDFIILFLPLSSGILTEPETVTILQHCLQLLERGEYSVKRRIFKLVFPDYQEDQIDEVLNEESVELIVKGMTALFNKAFDTRDVRVFKILQTIFMEREVLIEPIITGLAKPILRLIALLADPQREQIGSKFFMTISTYYYIFAAAYVDGDASQLSEAELKVLAEFGQEHIDFVFEVEAPANRIPPELIIYHSKKLGLDLRTKTSGIFTRSSTTEVTKSTPLTFFAAMDDEEDELSFEGNNIAHLIRMKLFEGYLKLIDNRPFGSEGALANLIDLTHIWPDLHFNSKLVATAMSLLEKFKNSLEVESLGSISENAFELVLRVSVYLLKKLNENALINDWASHLERFLSKSTDNPVYVLASIRGITELISMKRSDIFRRLNEAAIKSAWRLMDDLRFHGPAFILINELAKYQLTVMLDILSQKMRDDEVIVRVEQLQRIIIFWKVAASQMEKHNVELDESLTCILLDNIEDPHPVLRQLAKSWLFDSSPFLDRILDPIIRKLIINCRLFVTVSGRAFHVTVFRTNEVMDSFKRLNIVVANNPSKFATFVLSTPPSKTVIDLLKSNEDDDNIRHENYSDILLAIGIRYLKASVLPFMGRRFRQDNLLVSTASCELLEVLIKLLQSHTPSFLTEALVEVLLKAYYQFVADDISTMQVNMINLLKVILFQTGFLERNKRNLSLFERIFREKRLLEHVIGSIRNNRNSHTLLKIVDFLDTTIEIFSTGFFPENKLKDVVSLVFESYFAYISAEEQPTASQSKFDSIVVLIDAVFKFVHKYFNLEEFEVPDKDRPKPWRFLSILSLGLYQNDKDRRPSPAFRLIEAYFLEYFDKIMIVLLKGWKITILPENEYQFVKLGPFGFDNIHFQAKQQLEEEVEEATPVGPKPEKVYPQLPVSLPEDNRTENGSEGEDSEEEEEEEEESLGSISIKIGNSQDDQLRLMTEKMYYKYPKEFVESLLKAWTGSYGPVTAANAFWPVTKQAKIIDMVSFFDFSISEFNKLILDSEVFKENKVRSRRNKGVTLGHAVGSFECAILALYYGYLKHKKHTFIEDNDSRKQQLRKTWNAVCEFLQEFSASTHPLVDVWVVNIYHLCARKFPTQEIIGEYSIKKLIHVHENDVLEKIVAFICEDEKTKLPFEKAGESEHYTFVFPLPALAVDLARANPKLYLAKLTAAFEEDFHLRYYTKIIALKCLKALTMELLKMTYENKSNNRIARRVRNIITRLFNYIESLLRNKLAINENLYVEIIEYLFIFLEDSRDFLMDAFQTPIEKFFDSDLFFECPSKSLILWAQIIYWQSAAGNRKILNKYLYK